MNITIVAGALSSTPVVRTLPSGDELTVLQLTTPAAAGRPKATVPVCVTGSAAASSWHEGDRLVVVGTVRRRFFRSAGQTASSTEIHASQVLPVTALKRVQRALREVADQLSAAAAAGPVA